ncbi:putative ABC exporter domain-containing protein [Hathewaya histolytica]|uniref:Uncharacterized protein n=1 Tax=Hathewaya histolytica TaxID=1498 RepID=A0A4U9QZJ4_HATHI|nr:putative ABC exporter domain-containing protein [Hathewaya histolytica]VTQ81810.1 Uncharacterised protein [Hathewaya histolytica]
MVIRDLKTLVRIQFLQFRAYKRYALSNPLVCIKAFFKAIWTMLFSILYFGIIFFSKKSINLSKIFSYAVIDYIIMGILIIIFLSNLLKKDNEYSSFSFNTHDVHYLFSSPISERAIFIFTLIKSSIRLFISYVLIGLFLILKFKIGFYKVLLGGLGFILIYLFIKGFNFLIFSLRSRVKCRKELRISTSIFLLISLGCGLYSLIYSKLEFRAIGFWQLKNFIIYPFKSRIGVLDFILMIALVIIIMYLSVYYAVDYYEEIAEKIEFIEEMKEDRKDTDINTYIIEERVKEDTKIESYKDNILTRINGAGAFLYKSYIFNTRNNTNKKYIIMGGIAFVVGIILTIYNNYFNADLVNKLKGFLITFCILNINLSQSFSDNLKYEMGKMYFTMVPDKIYRKINYIVIYNYILKSAVTIVLFIPIFFMKGINRIELLTGLICLLLINFISISVNNIFILATPLDINISESILAGISCAIMAMITILPLSIIYYLFKETNTAFGLSILVLIVINLFVVFISDKLFRRIER